MKIDKTAATLAASLGGVLIGGTAVGVLLLSGGTSHTPAPVQTIQPAAEQTTPRATPTSAIVSSTRVTLKVPAKTQSAPKVQAVTPNEETPVTDPTTDPAPPTDAPTSSDPTDSPRGPLPPHNGASGSDLTAPPPIGAPSP